MIEFAKLHAQKALEVVHNNVEIEFLDLDGEPIDFTTAMDSHGVTVQVNPNSILNCYPINEIE